MVKTCTLCDEMKPHSEFYAKPGHADGWSSRCRECFCRVNREIAYAKKMGTYSPPGGSTLLDPKACLACERVLPLTEFCKQNRRGKVDYKARCKECLARHAKALSTPEQRRQQQWVRDIARNYGLTPDDYEALAEEQGYGCAICHAAPPVGERLHVDHCHRTGLVRGLLCRSHNTALGMFNDDPELMAEAIAYILYTPMS